MSPSWLWTFILCISFSYSFISSVLMMLCFLVDLFSSTVLRAPFALPFRDFFLNYCIGEVLPATRRPPISIDVSPSLLQFKCCLSKAGFYNFLTFFLSSIFLSMSIFQRISSTLSTSPSIECFISSIMILISNVFKNYSLNFLFLQKLVLSFSWMQNLICYLQWY